MLCIKSKPIACLWVVAITVLLCVYTVIPPSNVISEALISYKGSKNESAPAVSQNIGCNLPNISIESCSGNLLGRIPYYKHLVHSKHMEKFPLNTVSDSDPTCLKFLHKKLREDQKFLDMRRRVVLAREACGAPDPHLLFPLFTEPFRDAQHHLSYCRNAKAGTTTLLRYIMALNNHDVVANISNSELHASVQRYFPPLNRTQKIAAKKQELKLVVVRHPFKRTLSAYVNKVIQANYYRERPLYKKMLFFSRISPSDVEDVFYQYARNKSFVPFKLREFPCPDVDFRNSTDSYDDKMETLNTEEIAGSSSNPNKTENPLLKPTFRGFALAVAFEMIDCNNDMNCIADVDVHHKALVVRCAPCQVTYDGIIKVESYEEDMKFFEDVLGLPPVWDCLQNLETLIGRNTVSDVNSGDIPSTVEKPTPSKKINFNQTKKRLTYAEYMSQLSAFERKLLYSAYYQDFKVFGYNPCDGL